MKNTYKYLECAEILKKLIKLKPKKIWFGSELINTINSKVSHKKYKIENCCQLGRIFLYLINPLVFKNTTCGFTRYLFVRKG